MDEINISAKIKYVTLIFGIIATLVLCLLYVYQSTQAELNIIIQIIVSGIGLTGLFYAAQNLHLMQANQLLLHKQQKRELSVKLISEWNNPEMRPLLHIANKLSKEIENLDPREITKLLSTDKEEAQVVTTVLNYFEKMALMIDQEMVDEKLLYEFFKAIVKFYYLKFSDYIEIVRKKHERPEMYCYFQKLTSGWSRK